jgi:peptidoglycan-N-acetylglucosamine deacetylase
MCRMSLIRLVIVITVLVATCAQAQSASREHGNREVWGFTGPWDARSNASVRAHGGALDAVVSGWIGLDSTTALPILPPPYADTVVALVGKPPRMAIVTTWHGTRFHPTTIRTLARDARRLASAASQLARHAEAQRYAGLVLDFEEHGPADLDGLLRVVRVMRDSARAHGVRVVAMAIPALDTAAYPAGAITSVADYALVMLYDQHWSTSEPGPIASPTWVRDALAMRTREVAAAKLVAAFPLYGYRWTPGKAADPISFADAQRWAAEARVSLSRDESSGTLRARAPGWELWTSDAALLAVHLRVARTLGVERIALWRLGQEDPGVWKILK